MVYLLDSAEEWLNSKMDSQTCWDRLSRSVDRWPFSNYRLSAWVEEDQFERWPAWQVILTFFSTVESNVLFSVM